ncbi:hypothetical protein [Amycolatopsis azurea]|uniref:hypothetical protein n=1 Tax=Amycolatopsis azurea TaxID=36819 RepID=UPI00068C4EAE|nr:hypothetical protein [Amycolatopsis azurea]
MSATIPPGTAFFEDGGTAHGTVLVAADGVGSVIRPQRLPHARVVDSGTRLIYGRVPLTPRLRSELPTANCSRPPVDGCVKSFSGRSPVGIP